MRIYIGRHVFTQETLDTIIREAKASQWKFHIAVHKVVDAMKGLNEAESNDLIKLVLSVAGKRGGRNSHKNKVVVAKATFPPVTQDENCCFYKRGECKCGVEPCVFGQFD